jgi:hypothetical protein
MNRDHLFLMLAAVCLVFPAIAQEQRSPRYAEAVRGGTRTAREADPAAKSEVFRDLFIPAGKSIPLESELDYSSAATVAVTVYCLICTSAPSSLANSGLVLVAFWSVPDTETYTAAENKSSGSFPYWDAGAAIFQVYGSRFRLVLQNTGKQAVALQQVTVFRR